MYSAISSVFDLEIGDFIMHLSTAIHRGPYTYRQCIKLKTTGDELQERLKWLTLRDPATSGINLGLNLGLNAVDIYQELSNAYVNAT